MSKNSLLAIGGCACSPIGGQAVLDGVMMRNGDIYGLAVRRSDGAIIAQRSRWKNFFSPSLLRLPFFRGFPILLETIVNGIIAVNQSVRLNAVIGQSNLSKWNLFISAVLAVLLAFILFLIVPHILSLFMLSVHLGGDVEVISFHLWDGFYKSFVFIAYISLISFIPEMRHIFEYHGAEHKVIHAWEKGDGLQSGSAQSMSRFHPRCGTTFLLLVICISIAVQASFIPLILKLWMPTDFIVKQSYVIFFKIFLIVPISGLSYEFILFTERIKSSFVRMLLQAPGIALQWLTTREPSEAQIEVALIALTESLEGEWEIPIHIPQYLHLSTFEED